MFEHLGHPEAARTFKLAVRKLLAHKPAARPGWYSGAPHRWRKLSPTSFDPWLTSRHSMIVSG